MKTTPKEAIYQGVWRGYGKLYNIKVENGYTTIIVKPGENVKQRSLETKKKFAGQKETNKTPNGKNIPPMFK